MSFAFDWPTFTDDFVRTASDTLEAGLNRADGDRPALIAGPIEVRELFMGTLAPELDLLEVEECSLERFRAVMRLTYAGDAHLTISTVIQANPLHPPSTATTPAPSAVSPGTPFPNQQSTLESILWTETAPVSAAAAPLLVPVQLKLSHIRLQAILVLVLSKSKGVTLVFKSDPLQSVHISSSFDEVPILQSYIQSQIEQQLRSVPLIELLMGY